MFSIKIKPLAFESMGIRSMCTLVETPDVRLLIDPGLSLGSRFSLLPHPREYRLREKLRNKIKEAAERTDLFVITHYHFDHFTPFFEDMVWIGSTLEYAENLYQDKRILAKNYRRKINVSQRRRGWFFWKNLSKLGISCEAVDNTTLTFGDTKLMFSEPVPHGEENSILGWVIMLLVERDEEKFLYSSDIQGPISTATLTIIKEWAPHLSIIGGPSSYLIGSRIPREVIDKALRNLIHLSKDIPRIILDHHILRDSSWREFLSPLFKSAQTQGSKVSTAAEYLGVKTDILEYQRKKLYELNPPSQEFIKWSKLPKDKRKKIAPPI